MNLPNVKKNRRAKSSKGKDYISESPTATIISAPTISPESSISSVPSISYILNLSSPVPFSVPAPIDCTDPETRERLLMEKFVGISGEKSFIDPNSPQSKAANWIINEDPLNANPCTFSSLAQRYAMGVFYFALNGDDWIYNGGWFGGTS
eukprot:11659919-Ditylum_brightwellii.AAC.1